MRIGAGLLLLGLATASPAAIPKPEELLQIQAKATPSADARSATIRLDVHVAEGWHVNSHTPSEEYLIATTATLDKAEGLSISEPVYPPGKLKKFAFSEKPLSVYEGVFAVEIPVSWTGAPPWTKLALQMNRSPLCGRKK